MGKESHIWIEKSLFESGQTKLIFGFCAWVCISPASAMCCLPAQGLCALGPQAPKHMAQPVFSQTSF